MQIVSYVSQNFTNLQAVYDYLSANVPWWDSTVDKLTAGNITLEMSSNNIKFTETSGEQTFTTASMLGGNYPVYILITDTAFLICWQSSSSGRDTIIVGKSTDGTNEHYAAIYKAHNTAIKALTYGAVTMGNQSIPMQSSAYNMQLIPVYATESAYNVKNAYIILMTTNTSYNGKFVLNGKKYVQGNGLALQYTE